MMKQMYRGLRLAGLSLSVGTAAATARIALTLNPLRVPDRLPEEPISFVCYSITPWDGVWQRPQQFATRFSQFHPGIYVDPVGVQHILSAGASPVLHSHSPALSVFCPRVLPMGKTNSRIIDFNDALIIKRLEKLIRQLHLGHPVLITNTPLADTIANRYPWRAVAFDVIDDFTKWAWSPRDAGEREQRLFSRADTVFTGTYALWQKKHQFHPETEFIPCGVEIDHFMKANDPDCHVPDDIASIKSRGPVIGYFGGLNERIDADLLVYVAESIPTASVVLIGPIFADFGLSDFEDKWASLLPDPTSPGFRLKPIPPNLHIMGIRKYQELPAYLKAFDVCLLPYVLSQATIDIHPVKGLEYLAAGRPVVSTPLPDVKAFYSGIIDVADTPEGFVEAIRYHLKTEDRAKARERIEFAKPKTWENMMERMRRKILKACNIDA
ncbi:glycosyltransferase [bacterium]|nr:glycosyltransferase [candidate division CSSED10-310 bacterium]